MDGQCFLFVSFISNFTFSYISFIERQSGIIFSQS